MLVSSDAVGAALVWPAVMVVWGEGAASSLHRHHAWQLMVALEGELLVRERASGPATRAGGVWIRSDAAHAIDARGAFVLMGFFDPESRLASRVSSRSKGSVTVFSPRELARFRKALGPGRALDAERVAELLRAELQVEPLPRVMHPGVRRVLRLLQTDPGALEDASLESLSAVARLSPSRFMHVFTETVGVPLRPYLAWLRLQRAAGMLASGLKPAAAAAASGFSDAAHLSRTLRRMLGTTPAELARRSAQARGTRIVDA